MRKGSTELLIYSENKIFEFHPQVLKQYNRRWFVFGINNTKQNNKWIIFL